VTRSPESIKPKKAGPRSGRYDEDSPPPKPTHEILSGSAPRSIGQIRIKALTVPGKRGPRAQSAIDQSPDYEPQNRNDAHPKQRLESEIQLRSAQVIHQDHREQVARNRHTRHHEWPLDVLGASEKRENTHKQHRAHEDASDDEVRSKVDLNHYSYKASKPKSMFGGSS
jgi:hypothetical protein